METFRILMEGGIFIAHYKTMGDSVNHLDNYNNFPKNFTPDPEFLIQDLEEIGFQDVTLIECENYVDGLPEWYLRGVKPKNPILKKTEFW
jgi:hypothetical protein